MPGDAKEVYERLPIPGPARTFFQAALANLNPHSPTKVNTRTMIGRRCR